MEIIDYPNYLIYSDGRVFTKKSNRFLKPATYYTGYKYVNLCKNGKQKHFTIHRLIAIHYIPNPENKPCVDHINRNRSDNRIENLRWVSLSENEQNKGKKKNNTSGHTYIQYDKNRDRWIFRKIINGNLTFKRFKTKTEALCYKFICILKTNLI